MLKRDFSPEFAGRQRARSLFHSLVAYNVKNGFTEKAFEDFMSGLISELTDLTALTKLHGQTPPSTSTHSATTKET